MSKLGIVSDEQFDKELSDCRVTSRPDVSKPEVEIVDTPIKGRPQGGVEVPENLRKLIADDHLSNGRASALELAKDFGISSSSVSAYAVGSTSTATYNEPDKTLTNYLTARKNRITKKALRVLTSSLDTITPEKLQSVKAKDLASIAKDMSHVVNNMSPKEQSGQANQPKFVIYAPTVRDERSYESIVVNDNY